MSWHVLVENNNGKKGDLEFRTLVCTSSCQSTSGARRTKDLSPVTPEMKKTQDINKYGRLVYTKLQRQGRRGQIRAWPRPQAALPWYPTVRSGRKWAKFGLPMPDRSAGDRMRTHRIESTLPWCSTRSFDPKPAAGDKAKLHNAQSAPASITKRSKKEWQRGNGRDWLLAEIKPAPDITKHSRSAVNCIVYTQ